MGNDVRKMTEAGELWDKVCADDRVAYLSEPEAIEPEFRRQSRLGTSSPKVWADSYLLAFATVAGLKLVTFDERFVHEAQKCSFFRSCSSASGT
jgi:uncharacterized protein